MDKAWSSKAAGVVIALGVIGLTVVGAIDSNHAAAAARTNALRVTATASALGHLRATATARREATQTAVALATLEPQETTAARVEATRGAVATATAGPRATLAAQSAQATRYALQLRQEAHATQIAANAYATAVAVHVRQTAVAADAYATAYTLHVEQTEAAQPTDDTYAEVDSHPELYWHDLVQWTCNVYKFLSADSGGNDHMECWEYTGTYQCDTGDGSIDVVIPWTIDDSSIVTDDDVTVYGQIDQPMTGTNAYGGTITTPSIYAKSITNLGKDPNC